MLLFSFLLGLFDLTLLPIQTLLPHEVAPLFDDRLDLLDGEALLDQLLHDYLEHMFMFG